MNIKIFPFDLSILDRLFNKNYPYILANENGFSLSLNDKQINNCSWDDVVEYGATTLIYLNPVKKDLYV